MYLKVVSDLFLGSQEINRLIQSLDEKGFRKLLLQNSLSFGLVNSSQNGNFDNFKVAQGTNAGTIKHEEGIAINNDGQIIYKSATDNITLTNDNAWYWIKISHTYSTKEIGSVSVDTQGNLTGVGTEFTKILRGTPNNPIRIKFDGATHNTSEYDVLEVISDTNATLMGDFKSESNLTLVVVGAYTPDVVIASGNKYPFQYDGCVMTIVAESVSNTPPTLIANTEFVIARVKRNGSTITIEDKRSLNIYRTKTDYDLNSITTVTNPLIGIEAIKYDHNNTPRDKNIVYVGWGMRSSNWTFDSSINRVTIIGGLGGKFKTTANFTNGDFDGWILWTANGKKHIIKQSSISALQINLILDTLDPDDFNDSLTQELHVTPNVEEIELIATPVSGELPAHRSSYPINEAYAKLHLIAYDDPSSQYVITYRYKTFKLYSEETIIPDDLSSGYLVEADFNVEGVQTASARQTYEDGIITLVLAANAYTKRLASVETGDILGIEYLEIDTTGAPIRDFIVGQRKRYVIITNDDDTDASDSDFGTQYIFTANGYLNLVSGDTLEDGNEFLIQVRGDYAFNGFGLRIVQDYVNPGNPGIDLYGFTQYDLDQARVDNLFFRCLWDGQRWVVQRMVHLRENAVINESIKNSTILKEKIASGQVTKSADGIQLLTKVVEIGTWNMDSTQQVSIAHGIADVNKIRRVSVTVRSDPGAPGVAALYDFLAVSMTNTGSGTANTGVRAGEIAGITSTDIVLQRMPTNPTGPSGALQLATIFDSNDFDSTAINRGWITIEYEA